MPFWIRNKHHRGDTDDLQPVGEGPGWVIGVLLPLVLLVLGIICIDGRVAWMPGFRYGGGSLRLLGNQAIAFGISLIGAAFILHAWSFLRRCRRLYIFTTPALIAGLLAFIGGLGYIIVMRLVFQLP